MIKRAAIYLRVSSEKQAEKVSPEAQEADCRALCERKGYQVINVYRDIEKYRVGRRMVEPSGTRADRPALKAMLAAAREGRIDVIVAWREDRLYRSYRPMLDVLDVLDETDVDIELAMESFDKRMAPVKAWAARLELDAKQDRFAMGVAGRLERGKPWLARPPYGYGWVDGDLVPIEEEAQWVRTIYELYANGMGVSEIRMQLINSGAQQRTGKVKRSWVRPYIYRILSYETYFSGIMKTTWAGKTYETTVPPIVALDIAKRVKARREKYHQYPAGNLRELALAAGLVYCEACGTMLYMDSHISRGKRYVYYRCHQQPAPIVRHPDCCKQVRIQVLDGELWARVWALVGVPGQLEHAIQQHVEALKVQEADVSKDMARLEREIDDLGLERQKIITWARKNIINEEDMAQQLLGLDIQIKTVQRELSDAKLLTGNRAQKLLELAEDFRANVQHGLIALNEQPETKEEMNEQIAMRRQVVENVVSRVDVLPDKSLRVHFSLDFDTEVFVDQSRSSPSPKLQRAAGVIYV